MRHVSEDRRVPVPLAAALAFAALAFLLLVPAAHARTGAVALAPSTHAAGTDSKAGATRYPRSYVLSDNRVAHWAEVMHGVAVHARPNTSAKVVTRLSTATADGTQNIVLVLDGLDQAPTKTWYRVRLAILPNNSTGWVPASALGKLNTVRTHLYVDRAKLRATLKRDGRTIFSTIVGIGHSYWPTPPGEYYIQDKLTGFNDPFYGPVAFGTSARSTKLTDWPGGGYVGVHGTSMPQILPGQVSHGCIRMPNAAILKLARLMQVGTPLTIT
jgi:lipoprotein-anchoring transpeptidase ErfK/SrfK